MSENDDILRRDEERRRRAADASAERVERIAAVLDEHPGGTLKVGNDHWDLLLPGFHDLPAEDPEVQEGDALHWETLEARAGALVISVDGSMPHELLTALARRAGYEVESE